MTHPARRLAPTLLTVLGLLATLALTGCSQDRHVYRSTQMQPKSVSLVSLVTQETLWTMDVPVGQQLLLDFSRDGKGFEAYTSADIPADQVDWELWTNAAVPRYGSHMKGGSKVDSGREDLPGDPVMIKVNLIKPDMVSAQ
jgi:hypothetical protein